jgi:hypothetical protein
MPFLNWFAQEYFSCVRNHEQHCQKYGQAFCNLYERQQNEILCSHFACLKDVRTCRMGWPYPQGKESDVFIETLSEERLYCEMKGMWKTWFKQKGRPYPAFLWSPFRNASKDNSAGFDLAKLATLSGSDTTHIALIIMGSSLPADLMDEDLDTFAQMAHVHTAPWESYRDYWPNRWGNGYYYDLRVWGCEWKNVPEWWASIADVFRPYGY